MVDAGHVLNPISKQKKWSGNILKVKLYRYQRKAVRIASKLGSLGLWMEQGTGKTLTSLKIAGNYWARGLIDNLLILGPKSVLTVWEQELTNLCIPYEIVDNNPLKPVYNPQKLSICLCNYESLKKYKGKASSLKKGYDMVIADESHRVKNPNSIQSKQTYFLSRNAKYRLALSGTPKGNSDYDFFAQYKFINDEIFGPRTTKHKEEYFEPCGWMGHDLRLRKDKKEKFYRLVNENSFRITKEEALDLPPITETKVLVKLDQKTQKIYNKLEQDKFIDLEMTSIDADLAITLVTKLQQLCCGFIYDENKDPIELGNCNKLKYLNEIIEDHKKEKVVIFCKYTHEIDIIKNSLKKYRILCYDGRSEDKDWLKFLDGYDILITQIKKGGTGLNLQCASTVIFFSLTYSYIDLSQAKDRVHRNGQKNKVSIYYLLGKDTIEENIYKVLQSKKSGAKKILDDYRLSRL